MRRFIILISVLCAFAQNQKASSLDFFMEIAWQDGVRVSDHFLNEERPQSISFIVYEFFIDGNPKNGEGTFFAVPKREFSLWRIEGDRSEWEREKRWENSLAKSVTAVDLLFSDRDTLIENFDLFVFFVKPEDMIQAGGFMTDDGREVEDFMTKDDATVYTYRYENGMWIEINREKISGGSTRIHGVRVMRQILQERFGGVILDQ